MRSASNRVDANPLRMREDLSERGLTHLDLIYVCASERLLMMVTFKERERERGVGGGGGGGGGRVYLTDDLYLIRDLCFRLSAITLCGSVRDC